MQVCSGPGEGSKSDRNAEAFHMRTGSNEKSTPGQKPEHGADRLFSSYWEWV